VKRQKAATAKRAAAVEAALTAAYPNATCGLDFRNPYELLVATILSAQCTDARVNMVTPALFTRFPDATALAQAEPAELEEMIHSTGFYRNKAKSLTGMARTVVERHAGDIPPRMDDLTTLPGVGRKTANVVLGTALGLSTGVVVDTHVARLAKRLGFSAQGDPDKIEQDLMKLFPASSWVALGHRLILHGRRVCHARKPDCDHCPLAALCPRIGV
jgi:endonuclease-3